jgi:hypothetical protein
VDALDLAAVLEVADVLGIGGVQALALTRRRPASPWPRGACAPLPASAARLRCARPSRAARGWRRPWPGRCPRGCALLRRLPARSLAAAAAGMTARRRACRVCRHGVARPAAACGRRLALRFAFGLRRGLEAQAQQLVA